MAEALRIGELADRLDLPVETIRYYEKAGLLPAVARTAGNYRLYGDATVERLRFIRNCRLLDMPLDEVRLFLDAKDAPDASCDDINARIDRHIAGIDARMAELARLRDSLATLRGQCAVSGDARHCGILRELAHDHDPHTPCLGDSP